MAKYYSEPSRTFNEYLLIPNLTTEECIPSNVDLSAPLVKFKKGEELEVASVANYTVPKNEVIFAMGEPNGLSNTVSMGYILGNKVFTPDSATLEMSNVTFSVYINSAPIDSGSSGGALIDSNLRLVGINFASAVDQSTGDFKYTYTIPIERVREFITSYTTIEL